MLESFFTSHAWRFAFDHGQVIAPGLKLYRNGSIGAYVHSNERCWAVDGDDLLLKNISGMTTVRFRAVDRDDVGILRMEGASTVSRGTHFVLERTTMPSLIPVTEDRGPRVEVTRLGASGPRRRNLVFVSAGPSSAHLSWPKYIAESDRNWDLFTNWYGEEAPPASLFGEYVAHQPRKHKLSSLYNVVASQPDLLDYDNFWIPDDDVETSWKDVNRLFNIFVRTNLSLAQPALRISTDCHVNHLVTAQDPLYFLRYTSFVEIMCPLLSRELLEACLPMFNGTGQPYLVDHIMAGIEGRIPGKTAIIDDVAVTHSRPLATNYDFAPLLEEGERLSSMYFNMTDRYDVIGGIMREKIVG